MTTKENAMTVAELREKLEDVPDDAKVLIYSTGIADQFADNVKSDILRDGGTEVCLIYD